MIEHRSWEHHGPERFGAVVRTVRMLNDYTCLSIRHDYNANYTILNRSRSTVINNYN